MGRARHPGNFDVITQQNAVDIARKEVSVQQSGHYPTLDLVASHLVQDSSRDRPLADAAGNLTGGWQKMGPRAETDSVGLQLVVPFFQGDPSRRKPAKPGMNWKKPRKSWMKSCAPPTVAPGTLFAASYPASAR